MGNEYSAIAGLYDEFRGENPCLWAQYIDMLFKKFSAVPPHLVLDLCCGTGTVTSELIKLGYDMTGVDSSEQMLALAQINAPGALLLQQDMKRFELYGTVDAAVCNLDGINYLCSYTELLQTFENTALFLNPDGLFIFDVNTKYKYETVYADNDFILESKSGVLCWSCQSNSRGSRFFLSYFKPRRDGLYERLDEEQTQHFFLDKTIRKAAAASGFEILAVYDRLSENAPTETSEKIHYIMKKK